MNKGSLFIVFEGIDGSGKSTQCEMILEFLRNKRVPCKGLREPTGGLWGEKIRLILQGEKTADPEEQVELFMLDREDDSEKNIRPALEAGYSVVMDRYLYSNAAYQGALGLDPLKIIDENRLRNFPEPDRVYFIDVDPQTAVDRIAARNSDGSVQLFERLEFLKKVRQIFLQVADDSFLIVDGSGSPEDIHEIIKADIKRLTDTSGVL